MSLMNFLHSEGLQAVFCRDASAKTILRSEPLDKPANRRMDSGDFPDQECWVMVQQSPEIAPRHWLPNNQRGGPLKGLPAIDLREIVVYSHFQESDAEWNAQWPAFPKRTIVEQIVLSWCEVFSCFLRDCITGWFLPDLELRGVVHNAANGEMWEYDEFHRLFVPFVERTHQRIL
ncbi:MAG: hypothetical protein KDA84_00980 [Planctomycetaceae bacterium]|nr:hypothetical protein [Planctomycetaceae bacterium]